MQRILRCEKIKPERFLPCSSLIIFEKLFPVFLFFPSSAFSFLLFLFSFSSKPCPYPVPSAAQKLSFSPPFTSSRPRVDKESRPEEEKRKMDLKIKNHPCPQLRGSTHTIIKNWHVMWCRIRVTKYDTIHLHDSILIFFSWVLVEYN